jgi:hypothetical protein
MAPFQQAKTGLMDLHAGKSLASLASTVQNTPKWQRAPALFEQQSGSTELASKTFHIQA